MMPTATNPPSATATYNEVCSPEKPPFLESSLDVGDVLLDEEGGADVDVDVEDTIDDGVGEDTTSRSLVVSDVTLKLEMSVDAGDVTGEADIWVVVEAVVPPPAGASELVTTVGGYVSGVISICEGGQIVIRHAPRATASLPRHWEVRILQLRSNPPVVQEGFANWGFSRLRRRSAHQG